jgi:hypothetical protein
MSEIQTLKQRYDALSAEIDAVQIESAERKFEINLDDRQQVKTIMEHLNRTFTWKTQNAAVIVSLYDQLKRQQKEIANSDAETVTILLRGHELNALYQALLNVEGQGIEAARRFITMLTNVGEAVGTAMQELSELNTNINEMHTELSEIEQQMAVHGADATMEEVQVEPELETNEAEK